MRAPTSSAALDAIPDAALAPDRVIADGIRGILAKVLERDITAIGLEASLADDLGMDSLTAIEASIAVERRFGVTMPEFATPDELGLVTVADLVRLTTARVRASGGAP